MVRLKSRYLLFEVLYPEQLRPAQFYSQSRSEPTQSLHTSENKTDGSTPQDPSQLPPEILTFMQLRQPAINLDSRRVLQILKNSISTNFGVHGAGHTKSTLAVKYFSPRTSTGIIRVARDHVRLVWAALSYINEIEGKKVVIRVVRISGTIKKCEQAAIARDKKVIAMITNGLKNGTNQNPVAEIQALNSVGESDEDEDEDEQDGY